MKEQKKRLMDDFEQKERELKRQSLEKESFIKEMQGQVERVMMEKRQIMF